MENPPCDDSLNDLLSLLWFCTRLNIHFSMFRSTLFVSPCLMHLLRSPCVCIKVRWRDLLKEIMFWVCFLTFNDMWCHKVSWAYTLQWDWGLVMSVLLQLVCIPSLSPETGGGGRWHCWSWWVRSWGMSVNWLVMGSEGWTKQNERTRGTDIIFFLNTAASWLADNEDVSLCYWIDLLMRTAGSN